MNFLFSLIVVFCLTAPALAQDALPQLPDPIQNLVNEGAQIRYLGQDGGLDGWLTIKNGQEQYFYVKPDGSAFTMGLLFDRQGKAITVQQIQRLRGEEGDSLDALAGEAGSSAAETPFALQTPAEKLFSDIESSNWVPVGQRGAPVLYSFIDPQCGHCHAFMKDAQSAIEQGVLQVRMIPIGFAREAVAQAAFLLAAPKPQERWFQHMAGDEAALPAKSDINMQGVQRNLAIMQSWELDVTPILFYRSAQGDVKIVRGRPKDLDTLIRDIQSAG